MEQSLIVAIFSTIQSIVENFGSTFANLFADITNIFFVVGAENTVSLTPVGVLSLCVFGISLIWLGIRWLSRLIKMRG